MASKGKPRMLSIQKSHLVSLVQNFFIRVHGCCTNVNFEDINLTNWFHIASILNTMGPSKTKEEWKKCFYFMTYRIQKKVEFIKKFGVDPKDNLSEVDYKIFEMSSMAVQTHDESVFVERDCNDARENQSNLENVNDAYEFENDNVSVIETQEEVEEYVVQSVIEEDAENASNISNTQHFTEDLPEVNNEFDDSTEQFEATTYRSPSSHAIAQVRENIDLQESVRIPGLQKERLVQLIQNDFFKLFGQFTGTHGSFMTSQAWAKIASELNTLGPPRSVEQWKKTFNNIKASAKAKLADDHNKDKRNKKKNLTRLEEKVLSIFGIDIMHGNQSLGEAGFQYDKTVPVVPNVELMLTNSEEDNENFGDWTENMNGEESERDLLQEIRNGPDHNENITETIQSQRRMIERNVAKPRARASISEVQNNNQTSGMSTSISNRGNIGGTRGTTVSSSHPVDRPTTVRSSFVPPSARHNVTPSSPLDETEQDVLNQIIQQIRNGPDDNENITGSRQSQRQMIERNISEPPARPRASNKSLNTNSRSGMSASIPNRGNIGGARGMTVTSRPIDRSTSVRSAFLHPRARHNVRGSPPFEYISNINKFINDDGDDDESFDSSRVGSSRGRSRSRSRGRGSIRSEEVNYDLPRRDIRDRSDLRNKYTSYDMVQSSMSAQDRFIPYSNRNHSEIMFWTALADVAQEYVNRMQQVMDGNFLF